MPSNRQEAPACYQFFSESYIKFRKIMKMEGCASSKFIKSYLPESMIYTSEHMTINIVLAINFGHFEFSTAIGS